MNYVMKAGTLYFNDIMPARIKGALTGLEKDIFCKRFSAYVHKYSKPGGCGK